MANVKKTKTTSSNSKLNLTRITRTIYFMTGIYSASIIMFDSGNLITRESVIQRWTLASALLIINTLVWFVASNNNLGKSRGVILTYILTLALLTLAGFTTYWERGMASTSTIFYILPLLVVATLRNRHALLSTAVLASGIYSYSSVKYFNDFFNEGYRIQLWGQLFLYIGTILTASWLIMIISGLRHDSK